MLVRLHGISDGTLSDTECIWIMIEAICQSKNLFISFCTGRENKNVHACLQKTQILINYSDEMALKEPFIFV